MSDLNSSDLQAQGTAIFARAKAILLNPADTWPKIAAEGTSGASVFMGYVVPLAAIGPIARFLHGQIFGEGWFGISFHPGLISGLTMLIVSYVLSLVGFFVVALVADFLAPKFGGQGGRSNALKLIGYGATASFVAGAFALAPGLGFLGILGLYSFYLFYLGAGPLLQVPQDKAVGFTIATVVVTAVVMIVVGTVASPVTGLFGGGYTSSSGMTGKVDLPGGGSIDTAKLNQAAQQMQSAADGKKPAIDPERLKALLPGAVGSFQRTAVESTGVGGVGSAADGTYTAGSNSYHLKITDMAVVAGLAGIGTAFGIQENKEDADGYEKTGTVDGHLQTEAWHKGSSSGRFSVIVANRFSVEAEGSAGSIDDLKAAVAAINQGSLTALAN
eukprot:gene9885-9951_t